MNTIVSGSSGFIASHLCEAIPEALGVDRLVGPHTSIIQDLSRGFEWNLDKVDVLYHLAAMPWASVKGRTWFESSEQAFRNNAVATFNALQAFKPKRVVFSSSANLYGEGRKLREDSPVKVSSGYGYSKWIGEEVIRKSGIPYTILRFGTVVGARGRCFPNRLVWCAVHGVPVEIFCDGNGWRDIVDVRDVVDALMHAPEFPQGTYNVASGNEISGRALAELVAEEARCRDLKPQFSYIKGHAPGYVRESTLNIEKVSPHWKPKYDIYRTVESLFNYYMAEGCVEPPRWEET